MDLHPESTARQAYQHELNFLPVADAAVAVPFGGVERSLQRHKVRNRPPLPATRQDLILQPGLTTTLDGRRLILIDNGTVDRMIVFGTTPT